MQARLEDDSDGVDIAIDRCIWEGMNSRSRCDVTVRVSVVWFRCDVNVNVHMSVRVLVWFLVLTYTRTQCV